MASPTHPEVVSALVERKRLRLERFLSGVGNLYPKLLKVYREGLAHEEMSVKLATAGQVKDIIKAQIPREEKHEHSGHIDTGEGRIENLSMNQIEARIAAINREIERRKAKGPVRAKKPGTGKAKKA